MESTIRLNNAKDTTQGKAAEVILFIACAFASIVLFVALVRYDRWNGSTEPDDEIAGFRFRGLREEEPEDIFWFAATWLARSVYIEHVVWALRKTLFEVETDSWRYLKGERSSEYGGDGWYFTQRGPQHAPTFVLFSDGKFPESAFLRIVAHNIQIKARLGHYDLLNKVDCSMAVQSILTDWASSKQNAAHDKEKERQTSDTDRLRTG